MPICTTCTNFTPYLYTVYQSANNLRLEQCSACHAFADPYVEHDSLTLLLDLILLKRGVYRHLLYNRGTEPSREEPAADSTPSAVTKVASISRSREKERWLLIFRLGGTLVFLDTFIRWSYLNPTQLTDLSPWTEEILEGVLRVLLGCLAETLAFHLGVMIACYIALRVVALMQSWRYHGRSPPVSHIKREFRFSLVPLTLFYSSLTKLFLLFLLTIWRPTGMSTPAAISQSSYNLSNGAGNFLLKAFEVLDDDHIDREWVIRNALGGMSAGFGLRVVLDIHPILTSLIIFGGWKAKTVMTGLISGWIGGDRMMGEAWKAYSIP